MISHYSHGGKMSTEITCPRCGQPVLPQLRYCEHCGVDLAMAAVLAEQQVMMPVGFPAACQWCLKFWCHASGIT